MKRLLYLFCVASFWVGSVASADDAVNAREQLSKALEAQDKGDDQKAIGLYEEVLKSGHVNGHIYYNLGISYFRSQKVGESMAAFLAARKYLPRDPDVQANIRFVQAKIPDKLEPALVASWWRKITLVVDWFTKRELSLAGFASLLFVSALTLAGLLVQRLAPFGYWGSIGFVAPFVIGLVLTVKLTQEPKWGAIRSAEGAKVFSGPGDSYTQLFSLQVGAPVNLNGEERQNYLPIEISDGKKGWVLASQVAYYPE